MRVERRSVGRTLTHACPVGPSTFAGDVPLQQFVDYCDRYGTYWSRLLTFADSLDESTSQYVRLMRHLDQGFLREYAAGGTRRVSYAINIPAIAQSWVTTGSPSSLWLQKRPQISRPAQEGPSQQTA